MFENIAEPLLSWYDGHARELPWRSKATPYRVWVSEIMLQQTRVEAVKPFFERFTKALPDVRSLAVCPEDRLLKLWEGLGYYSRVRNMQKAAITMVEQYNSSLPADYQKLLELKGIGSYTAGAIASIAYGIAVPAVDGNVLRVAARLTCLNEDVLKISVKRQVEDSLSRVIPRDRPGDFNQALMELGAMICLPNGMPHCNKCPIEAECEAYARNVVLEYPKKAPKKGRRVEEHTVIVVLDGERAAIRKREKKGLLQGMYELPNIKGHLTEQEVLTWVKEFSLDPIRIQRLPDAKHIFSHVEWRMRGYMVRIAESSQTPSDGLMLVLPSKTEQEYPIPAAFGAYTRYMNVKIGQDKYSIPDTK